MTEAARAARVMFNDDLADKLDGLPDFQERWVDAHLHGSVAEDERHGMAIRNVDRSPLAPGLYAPAYARLNVSDVPDRIEYVAPYLRALIARNPRGTRDETGFVAATIAEVTRTIGPIDRIAETMWTIRSQSPALYAAAMLGDFPAAAFLFEQSSIESTPSLVAALAGLRAIWAAADVQRVAVHGRDDVQRLLIPWFMKIFGAMNTVADVVNLMKRAEFSIDRLYRSADLASEAGKEKVQIHGPKGPLIATVEDVAAPLEQRMTDGAKTIVKERTVAIAEQAATIIGALQADTADQSHKATIHQWQFANLSPVAALFVTCYRFAEEEAAMARIIARGTMSDDLWSAARRPFPASIDRKLWTRAINLGDAARRAMLQDVDLNNDTAADRHPTQWAIQAQATARTFLADIGSIALRPNGTLDRDLLSRTEFRAAHMFDLSHLARTCFVTSDS
ncbi:MAG: hypothetical protein J0J06_01545 [Sphingomonas sp.]|uniref:hypothetical protein n=1 Tax=Sphingomonas sp. TaxID=28214 RepID=UPI001AC49187|nr:hypothetical protein [Sphingomonas sp.]MBN8814114.1 hypothetical protein [Sphingomonas sp.]